MRPIKRLVKIFVALTVIGLGLGAPWFAERGSAAEQLAKMEATGDARVETGPKGLGFVDHTGRAVSERDFAGRHMLVFFGYTHCPDVCPADLAIMSSAMRKLGSSANLVQPVFITFDPERDTPEVLAKYVRHFDPRLTGLTGTAQQISAAARAYGVLFVRDEGPGGEGSSDYSLRHTAMTYLIGPDGKGLAMFEHGSDPNEMAAVILEQLERDGFGVQGEARQ